MLCKEILHTVFLGRLDDTAEVFSPHETKWVADLAARGCNLHDPCRLGMGDSCGPLHFPHLRS